MAQKSFVEYLKSSIVHAAILLGAVGSGLFAIMSYLFGDVIIAIIFGAIALVGLFYHSYRLDELDRYRMGR
jgi:uncharacterized membrane protein